MRLMILVVLSLCLTACNTFPEGRYTYEKTEKGWQLKYFSADRGGLDLDNVGLRTIQNDLRELNEKLVDF